MTDRKVRVYPDVFLRKVAGEVSDADDSIRELIGDMWEAMDDEGGIGLAAPQIGVSKRVIVVSVEEKGFERVALINPLIVSASEETCLFEEGCLSVPGVRAEVARPSSVVVRGTTRSGRLAELAATNLLARVLQHEIDHLDGILFIDRLSPEERRRIEEDLIALRQRNGALA